MRIVRRGRKEIRDPERSITRPRGLLRQTTTATAQVLPTAAVRTNRRNALAETRHPTTTAAAIRSRALTIRRPRALTRLRELIPRLAVAIQRLRVPTPRPAAAIMVAVEAAAAAVAEAPTVVEAVVAPTVVEVVEVHTAVEAPALTATNNLFARHKRPAR